MHLKRSRMPKTWSLERKGTKYLVRPSHSQKNSVPLLMILRDMLKIVKNRKEAKRVLNLNKIKINGDVVKEESFPLMLFDNLSLEDKNFKIIFKNKKFDVVEISEKETEEKIEKVSGKKILRGNKLQINLLGGRNYLAKEKVKAGDSVVINLKEKKIKEILTFKSGCRVLFISGKHLGEEGIVEEIDEKKKLISIKVKGEKINSGLKSLMVIK